MLRIWYKLCDKCTFKYKARSGWHILPPFPILRRGVISHRNRAERGAKEGRKLGKERAGIGWAVDVWVCSYHPAWAPSFQHNRLQLTDSQNCCHFSGHFRNFQDRNTPLIRKLEMEGTAQQSHSILWMLPNLCAKRHLVIEHLQELFLMTPQLTTWLDPFAIWLKVKNCKLFDL